jgi:hypothetical protein
MGGFRLSNALLLSNILWAAGGIQRSCVSESNRLQKSSNFQDIYENIPQGLKPNFFIRHLRPD